VYSTCPLNTTQNWTLTVHDVTAGWTWTQTANTTTTGTNLDTCDVIMEAAQPAGLAQWTGKAQFTNWTCNGVDPRASRADFITLLMNNTTYGGTANVSTPVSTSSGANFNACWGATNGVYTQCDAPNYGGGKRGL